MTPMKKRSTGGFQPYRKNQARPQGPALQAMMRGSAKGQPHPSHVKRALQRGAKRGGALSAAMRRRGL